MVKPYYIRKLEEEFSNRRNKNSRYSLRAFAFFLGMYSGSLSSVLNGKRPLPEGRAQKIISLLNFSPEDSKLFLQSVRKFRSDNKKNEKYMPSTPDRIISEEEFSQLHSWEYWAVLNLTETENFKSDLPWIARRLNIPLDHINMIVDGLFEAGLLAEDSEGNLQRQSPFTAAYIKTSQNRNADNGQEPIENSPILKAQLQTLDIAKEKLSSYHPSHSTYINETLAFDIRKIPEVDKLIQRFYDELSNIMEGGTRTEVYRVAIQLFPLTNLSNSSDNDQD